MKTGEKFFHAMILTLPLLAVMMALKVAPGFFDFFGIVIGFCVLVFFGLLAIGSENPTPTGAFFRRFSASFGSSILIFIWPLFIGWDQLFGMPIFVFIPIPIMLIVTIVLPCSWYALTGFPPPWLRPRKKAKAAGGQVVQQQAQSQGAVQRSQVAQTPAQAAAQQQRLQTQAQQAAAAKVATPKPVSKPKVIEPAPTPVDTQAAAKPKAKPQSPQPNQRTTWSTDEDKPKPPSDGQAPSPDMM